MAKAKTIFFCSVCGNETPKWQGKCPACGAWNTLQEHVESPSSSHAIQVTTGRRDAKLLSQVDFDSETRFSTGIGELDRVLGGGPVEGSLVLVGGAPGIGKSTLLLQIRIISVNILFFKSDISICIRTVYSRFCQ